MSKQPVQPEITQSCCSTTDEGAAICLVPPAGQHSSCGCQQNEPPSLSQHGPTQPSPKPAMQQTGSSNQQNLRGGLMFAVACITSPCCTPLIMPLVLTLLAGTPVAVWVSAHIGWVYGGLTLISVISLVVGWRWLQQKTPSKPFTQSQSPVILKTKNL